MARIQGVDIPRDKRLVISLTYLFGIGNTTAARICDEVGIDQSTRVRDLTDAEVNKVREWIDEQDGPPRVADLVGLLADVLQ